MQFFRRTFKSGRWIAVVCALLVAGALGAESVRLRDGRVFTGQILTQNRDTITIRTREGVRQIPKSQVARISYRTEPLEPEPAVVPEPEPEEDDAEERREAELAALRREAEENRRRYLEERQRNLDALERQRQQPEPEPVVEPEPEPGPTTREDRWGAAQRSAAVPGWGHFYAGKPVFGVFYAGVFAYAAGNAAVSTQAATSARENYTSFTDTAFILPFVGGGIPAATAIIFETDLRASRFEAAANSQRNALNMMLVVYLFQLAHAALLSTTVEVPTAQTAETNNGFQLHVGTDSAFADPMGNNPGQDAAFSSPYREPTGQRYDVRFVLHLAD